MRFDPRILATVVLLSAIAATQPAPAAVAGPQFTHAPAGYFPTAPERVLDTRFGTGRGGARGKLLPGQTLSLDLTPQVDDLATAVVLNVTADSADADGFLTAFPCDVAPPDVSNLNYIKGETRANLVTVRLSVDRRVCITTSAPVHVIADFSGDYSLDAVGGYTPLTPVRKLDTRTALGTPPNVLPGVEVRLPLTSAAEVPDNGVLAVTMNVTAVHPTANGFVTVYPCGTTPPNVSNINFNGVAVGLNLVVVPNLVNVALGKDGAVCMVSSAPVDLLADLVGYYSAPVDVGFLEVTPLRAVDTRFAVDPRTATLILPTKQNPATVLELDIAAVLGLRPGDLAGVLLNVTAVNATGDGFIKAYPCGVFPPDVSSLNFGGGSVSNLVNTRVAADGTVCFVTSFGGRIDMIVDVAGIFSAAPGPSPFSR